MMRFIKRLVSGQLKHLDSDKVLVVEIVDQHIIFANSKYKALKFGKRCQVL